MDSQTAYEQVRRFWMERVAPGVNITPEREAGMRRMADAIVSHNRMFSDMDRLGPSVSKPKLSADHEFLLNEIETMRQDVRSAERALRYEQKHREDIQQTCMIYYEMAYGLNVEVMRQLEVGKRLTRLVETLAGAFPYEVQMQVRRVLEKLDEFHPTDMERFANENPMPQLMSNTSSMNFMQYEMPTPFSSLTSQQSMGFPHPPPSPILPFPQQSQTQPRAEQPSQNRTQDDLMNFSNESFSQSQNRPLRQNENQNHAIVQRESFTGKPYHRFAVMPYDPNMSRPVHERWDNHDSTQSPSPSPNNAVMPYDPQMSRPAHERWINHTNWNPSENTSPNQNMMRGSASTPNQSNVQRPSLLKRYSESMSNQHGPWPKPSDSVQSHMQFGPWQRPAENLEMASQHSLSQQLPQVPSRISDPSMPQLVPMSQQSQAMFLEDIGGPWRPKFFGPWSTPSMFLGLDAPSRTFVHGPPTQSQANLTRSQLDFQQWMDWGMWPPLESTMSLCQNQGPQRVPSLTPSHMRGCCKFVRGEPRPPCPRLHMMNMNQGVSQPNPAGLGPDEKGVDMTESVPSIQQKMSQMSTVGGPLSEQPSARWFQPRGYIDSHESCGTLNCQDSMCGSPRGFGKQMPYPYGKMTQQCDNEMCRSDVRMNNQGPFQWQEPIACLTEKLGMLGGQFDRLAHMFNNMSLQDIEMKQCCEGGPMQGKCGTCPKGPNAWQSVSELDEPLGCLQEQMQRLGGQMLQLSRRMGN